MNILISQVLLPEAALHTCPLTFLYDSIMFYCSLPLGVWARGRDFHCDDIRAERPALLLMTWYRALSSTGGTRWLAAADRQRAGWTGKGFQEEVSVSVSVQFCTSTRRYGPYAGLLSAPAVVQKNPKIQTDLIYPNRNIHRNKIKKNQ